MAKKAKNPYQYFGLKAANFLLLQLGVSGFLFTPLLLIFGFVFELGLKYGVYNLDQTVIKGFNEGDKKAYFDLINTKDLKTEAQKEDYKKTFLKRLSNVLSVAKYIKK
jgi:hypothetical protein